MSCTGCSFNNSGAGELNDAYDWLNDLPETTVESDIVEVKFKSTRREFYQNSDKIALKRGDKVVVATSPGHDTGEVTLTGYLAEKQFHRKVKNPKRYRLNSVYRRAGEKDLDMLAEARRREKSTLIRSRQIAESLGLEMKIGDVEFRGDGKRAIFYYIADRRVDFRELIKQFACEFNIKVEMKQIGARQEAGLVGGIGSCGRELCCSSWRTVFTSITSDVALKQGLSPSAQKMAGACGKLKCCLLYELDMYLEARKEFPEELLQLETAHGTAKPVNTDYLKKEIWFSLSGNQSNVTFSLSVNEVKNIIQKNKKGIHPEILAQTPGKLEEPGWEILNTGRLDRFEEKKSNRKRKRKVKKGKRFKTRRQN